MEKWHIAGALAVVATATLWSSNRNDAPGAQLIVGRPWVTSLPSDPREPFHALFLAKGSDGGVATVGSAYQSLVNAVSYALEGDTLRLRFLQPQVDVTGKVRAWRCTVDRSDGALDLCLEVDYRWKTIRMYSSTRWTREQDAPAALHVQPGALVGGECPACRAGEPEWLRSFPAR